MALVKTEQLLCVRLSRKRQSAKDKRQVHQLGTTWRVRLPHHVIAADYNSESKIEVSETDRLKLFQKLKIMATDFLLIFNYRSDT